jgi:O-antigen/teichoic acid export membrane protein
MNDRKIAGSRASWKGLGANLGWLLASNGLMAVLSLIYVGILTRSLGLADFGRFALITGTAQMLAVLVSFETWKVIVQYGQRHLEAGDQLAFIRLLKASLVAELAGAGIGIAALPIVLIAALSYGLTPSLLPYAAIFAVVQLLSLRSTPTGIVRLKDRYRLGAIAESVQPVGRLVMTTAMLFLWPSIEGFLIGYATAELATALVYWGVALRLAKAPSLWGTKVRRQELTAENPGFISSLWSTNLQASLSLGSRHVPLLVAGGLGGAAAAGAFRLALQLANALSKIATLVMRAAFPEIIRSVRSVSGERFWGLIRRIALAGIVSSLMTLTLVLLLGEQLLSVIGGPEFKIAYVFLLWLAGAAAVEMAVAPSEPVLLSLHRPNVVIAARAGAIFAQLGALVVLLPTFGAVGASMSVLIGALCFGVFVVFGLVRVGRAIR